MITRVFAAAVLTAAFVIAAAAQGRKPEARPWPPRTPDGQPDIQGVWANPDTGIFTHGLESRAHLAALGEATFQFLTTSRAGRGVRPKASKTTYIVDPPDGVLPLRPW